MPLINLGNIKNEFLQKNLSENSWERRESNPGLLGEKRKRYLCAMLPLWCICSFSDVRCIVQHKKGHDAYEFLFLHFFIPNHAYCVTETGTWLTRPDPRPKIESTLNWVPDRQVELYCTGLLPMSSTTLCYLYLLGPFLSWFAQLPLNRISLTVLFVPRLYLFKPFKKHC